MLHSAEGTSNPIASAGILPSCYAPRGMRVLICAESELLRDMAVLALTATGRKVVAEPTVEALIAEVEGASALLVAPEHAKAAIRLLRDKGFDGRALLFATEDQEVLDGRVAELGADGALAAMPVESLGERFVDALSRRRRVLIVDDSEIAARLLGAELEPKGFEIQYAASAEEATKIILKKETRPDLILLDIHMEDVDGAQFCTFLKGNSLFRGIKVVLCSGASREEVEATAKASGADGYILKDEFLGSWVAQQLG